MSDVIQYKDLLAFHPGSYLKDMIEDLDMTQAEFAKRLNTTAKSLSLLLNGKADLSKEMAMKLSQMTGVAVDTWLNLQKKYDEKILEIKSEKDLDGQKEILSMLDYKYFQKEKVVLETHNKKLQIASLCQYLQIGDLTALTKPDLLTACRTSIANIEIKHVVNANAWIQHGINLARKADCAPLDLKKFKSMLPKIRSMSLQPYEKFFPALKAALSSCGVALVALPYLKDSGINGAVRWISDERIMLLVNDRRKSADIFWFSLFHEFGHILQNRKKSMFLTSASSKTMTLGSDDQEAEKQADEFSKDTWIPLQKYEGFCAKKEFNAPAICAFAKELGIAPFIVLGRLQHDGFLPWSAYHELKQQYHIKAS